MKIYICLCVMEFLDNNKGILLSEICIYFQKFNKMLIFNVKIQQIFQQIMALCTIKHSLFLNVIVY